MCFGATSVPQPNAIQIPVCNSKLSPGGGRNLELRFLKSWQCGSRISIYFLFSSVCFQRTAGKIQGCFSLLKVENLGFWHTVSFKRAHSVLETRCDHRKHKRYPSVWFRITPEPNPQLPMSSPHPSSSTGPRQGVPAVGRSLCPPSSRPRLATGSGWHGRSRGQGRARPHCCGGGKHAGSAVAETAAVVLLFQPFLGKK